MTYIIFISVAAVMMLLVLISILQCFMYSRDIQHTSSGDTNSWSSNTSTIVEV